MIGVDLFAGAGGMSTGAQWAGVDVRYSIECDQNAAETYRLNHNTTEVIESSVEKIECFSKFRNGQKIVLFGGPPCQGFSTSNQRTRSASNSKNWLFMEFLRAVHQLQPELVVFENVKGLAETSGAFFLNELLQGFEKVGYQSKYTILNSVDFGVPQKRSRLFVLASKSGNLPDFPEPSGNDFNSVRDAIQDLPYLENGSGDKTLKYKNAPQSRYAKKMRGNFTECNGHEVTRNAPHVLERYIHIPQGGNWEQIPEHLMGNYSNKNRCHTGIYRRLHWDKPSVVIGNYRKNMLIHPDQNRGLSVREAARLQSFPDSYLFSGSIGFKQQQVGNAVPPMLAEAIFSNI